MKPSNNLFAGLILCLAIAVASCQRTPKTFDSEIQAAETESSLLQVNRETLANAHLEYQEAKKHDIQQVITAYGEIVPNSNKMASIVSRIDGIVVDVQKQMGDAVAEGDVVAMLESQTLAAAVMTYLQAETQWEATRNSFAREKELYGKKLTSAEAYQRAEQDMKTAEIAHAAARQTLQLLHFEESELHAYAATPEKADLTKLPIRAPLDGIVTKRSIHRGQAVTADTTLFEVANLEEVWVSFNVPLAAARHLTPSQQIKVKDDALNQTSVAKVTFVSPVANDTNRTVLARASLANQGGTWRPGTPVSVTLAGNASAAHLAVPVTALLDYEGGYIVFIRKSEDTFELREVQPGRRDESHIEITDGIQAGESVVTTNAFALKALWQSQGA